ncbi:MAG: hypothetical protein ABIL11_01090, partial [Chloroflexota bacterium]
RNDRGYVSFAWNSGDFTLPKANSVALLLRNKCHCEERSSLLVTGDCFVAKNAPRNDRGYVSFALNSGDFPLWLYSQ